MKLDLALNIDVALDVLVDRLAGRRICRSCGASCHLVFDPPKQDGICDRCGGELYQRSDDSRDTVNDRLRVYTDKTAPLLDYYRQRHLLVDVDGEPEIDSVWETILGILGSHDR
jgi:adenylate kinase